MGGERSGIRFIRFIIIYLFIRFIYFLVYPHGVPAGGYSHTLPIRVCAAQRGRDFGAPDLERGIHFRGIF